MTVPRVRVFEALSKLRPIVNPPPVVTALSPSSGRSGQASLTLTLTGSGFDGFSVIRWNGSERLTTVVSTTTIQAAITAARPRRGRDRAESRSSHPPPGGGTSSALTFTITPGPTLTVSASTVAPGAVRDGQPGEGFRRRAGLDRHWLRRGRPNTSYLGWTYVGADVTPARGAWRCRRPPARTNSACSPTTVTRAWQRARRSSSIWRSRRRRWSRPSRRAATLAGAGGFTLTVSSAASSSRRPLFCWNGASRATTFVSATQLQAAIGAADIAAIGTAQVTVLTPSPGGGTSSSLTFIDAIRRLRCRRARQVSWRGGRDRHADGRSGRTKATGWRLPPLALPTPATSNGSTSAPA